MKFACADFTAEKYVAKAGSGIIMSSPGFAMHFNRRKII
jgi:hypothetical protein